MPTSRSITNRKRKPEPTQGSFWGQTNGHIPSGFMYRPDFVSAAEERFLINAFQHLQFSEVRMHGVVAKRRVVHFGWVYGYESWRLLPGPPIPEVLLPFRTRAAELVNRPPADFSEALVIHYPQGAAIGWHRDAPMFGDIVVGISLGSECRFRFRYGTGPAQQTSEVRLEPRSLYILSSSARWQWQHSIPATIAARYSVTFRLVRWSSSSRSSSGSVGEDT